MYNDHDIEHMALALEQGQMALDRGDFPVGAVLVIDGQVVGKTNNALLSKKTWGDHAETRLLLEHSQAIREAKGKNPNVKIELYSTLEPCLMCFGCAIMHRVNRIIFSLHDPGGGATHLSNKTLPHFYQRSWPKITSGIFKEESYVMFHQFMEKQETPTWKMVKKLFEDMKATWG